MVYHVVSVKLRLKGAVTPKNGGVTDGEHANDGLKVLTGSKLTVQW